MKTTLVPKKPKLPLASETPKDVSPSLSPDGERLFRLYCAAICGTAASSELPDDYDRRSRIVLSPSDIAERGWDIAKEAFAVWQDFRRSSVIEKFNQKVGLPYK